MNTSNEGKSGSGTTPKTTPENVKQEKVNPEKTPGMPKMAETLPESKLAVGESARPTNTSHDAREPDKTKRDSASSMSTAAKGDDDMMSKASTAGTEHDLKVSWKQQISAAKGRWSRLSEDELLKVEGNVKKLIELVKDRYSIAADEAEKQVKIFFDKFSSASPVASDARADWKRRVSDAKVTWGKLSEDELVNSEGSDQKLTTLVQARYSISREEASKQVKTFLNKHPG